MGTTAEKLTYLNETKGLIKDNINLTGAGLTNQTPFRQYATDLKTALLNILNNGTDTLYNNFPKTTGTGTNISLNNTLQAPIRSVINGDTQQDGTPTPATPVEIQSVTGLQKVNVCEKNLFDNTFNNLGFWSGSVGQTTTFGYNANYLGAYCKVKPGIYSISRAKITNRFVIALCKDIPSKDTSSTGIVVARNDSAYKIENINVSSEYNYIAIYLSNSADTSDNLNLQIEKGSTATTYEPYQSQEYEINLGKNLLPNTATSQTINGITYTINEDKTITANGTATAHSVLNIYNTSLVLQPGTYMFSGCPKNGSWETYSMGYGTKNDSGNGALISTTEVFSGVPYIRIANGTTVNNLLFKPMVEKGSQITSYSPYFTPIELNKIGNYKDYINGTPDNWVLHKNIRKINIIVNSTITHYGGRHWIGFSKPSDSIMHDAGNFNRYKLYMEKAYYSNTSDAIYSYQTGLAAYAMGVMCNENDDPTTLKNQLDGSLMYYPLKEEITTPITNTELISQLNALYNAKSYNGQTNISVEGDLSMILDVSAIIDE